MIEIRPLHNCNNYCTLKLDLKYVRNIFSFALPIARGLHSVQKSETESSICRGVVTLKGGVCASMTGQAFKLVRTLYFSDHICFDQVDNT